VEALRDTMRVVVRVVVCVEKLRVVGDIVRVIVRPKSLCWFVSEIFSANSQETLRFWAWQNPRPLSESRA
jgi:hypothetical protein